jgi:hypothetical protein
MIVEIEKRYKVIQCLVVTVRGSFVEVSLIAFQYENANPTVANLTFINGNLYDVIGITNMETRHMLEWAQNSK